MPIATDPNTPAIPERVETLETSLSTLETLVIYRYETNIALQAADVPSEAQIVSIAGREYTRASAEPTHTLKEQSNDGAWWEIAEDIIIPSDAVEAYDAALAADVLGRQFYAGGVDTVVFNIDPAGDGGDAASNFAIIEKAVEIATNCGADNVEIAIADGIHDFGTNQIQIFAGPRITLAGQTTGIDEVDITGLSAAIIPPFTDKYRVTATVGSKLPDRVVQNWAIGIQSPRGDNDADHFCGALRVDNIAGNKLSFDGVMRFHSAPVNPTTITNGGTYQGANISKLLIPHTCLLFSGGTAGIEGFINCFDGASVLSEYLGYSYNGAIGSGTVIYIAGGSRFEELKGVFAGGPERIIRGFGEATSFFNRTCLAAGDNDNTALVAEQQQGGSMTFTRCNIGGGPERAVLAAFGSTIYVIQGNTRGGAISALEATGSFAGILCYPSTIRNSGRACYALNGGEIQLSTAAVDIDDVDLGLDIQGGRIFGSPVFGGGVTTQSSIAINTFEANGSGWFENATAQPLSTNIKISDTAPQLDFVDSDTGTTAYINCASGFVNIHTDNTGDDLRIYGGPTLRFTFDMGGSFIAVNSVRVLSGVDLQLGGTKVVGTQGAAVSDLSIVYTTNDPAITPDGSVTFADGSAPTNSELLEAIVELNAKHEDLKARIETHGLIAS